MPHSRPNQPPLFVLKSVKPPLDEYVRHLNDIWDNRHFTNNGPKHEELESALKNYLRVPECVLTGNGTFALMAALHALGIEDGEVITTPFTFVATAHCLKPFNLTPVFVDIEAEHLTIDPAMVEAAITPETKAIIGVHVYGTPCDTDRLQDIATRHGLKLIYDAAHAFGVQYQGQSVLNFGDASCLSFHATKAFHTFEGGAVVTRLPPLAEKIRRYKNFGIGDDGVISDHGLNTKMSELHAAAGLVNLTGYESQVAQRQAIHQRYHEELGNIDGLAFVSFARQENPNYNYCPVRIANGRDAVYDVLVQAGIFTRKYFYPLLSDMPVYAPDHKQDFAVASRVAEEILCLPVYPDLSHDDQSRVIDIIRGFNR